MANLRVFDPLLSDSFEPFFRRFLVPVATDGTTDGDVPKIRIDVEEKDKSYHVRADIPGVKKEDINVRIEGNLVQIDAETHHEKEINEEVGKDKGRMLRRERFFGASSRTFSLAHEVDESKATAKYENGVLTLELPIHESTGTKRITVQ
jgi:HSP20 family protein